MELLMKRKQDTNLSWREYFNELKRTQDAELQNAERRMQNFAVDDKLMRRHKWRKVMPQKPPGKIMMAQWNLFKVTLENSLEKGDATNEYDVMDHILEQLTPKLREQVLKHVLKWRHQKFSVKVFVPPTIDWEELKTFFE